MKKEIVDYNLTVNLELDSAGQTDYVAALYTPSIGLSQGHGVSIEDAILNLAETIKGKKYKLELEKALTQSLGSWPFILPSAVDSDINTKNIGKMVWYSTGVDDTSEATGVLPAIITKEWFGKYVDLSVFGNKSGMFIRYSVPYSEIAKAGSWTWPKN